MSLYLLATYDATLLAAVIKVEDNLGSGAKTGDEDDDGIGSSRIYLTGRGAGTGL